LRHCTTADSLLRLLVRFSRLITPSFNLSYQRSERQGEFIWRPGAPMSGATLRAMQEGVAVSLHTEFKAMLGERLRPCDVYLSMPAPPHRSRYRQLRPTRYQFSSQTLPEVRLVMGAELLDLPLPQPDLHTDLIAESELQARQRAIGRSTRWSEWVSMMLREAEGCQPSRAQLAELLNVSEPTLVRYLAKEGHCLRDLGNRIRHERACALLQDSRQSITEIAYRLGYGDAANFSHAFRAASDLSPRAWCSIHTAKVAPDIQVFPQA
jgi:AraC-like DNA-binding protein